MLCFGALVKGFPDDVKNESLNLPEWFKRKLEKLHVREFPPDPPIPFKLPTFLGRRNKDGEIINAFDHRNWFNIRSRPSGI